MATDLELLIVTLEARTKEYERALAKAQGTTVSALRKIEKQAATSAGRMERELASAASRSEARFAAMGAGIASSLKRGLLGLTAGVSVSALFREGVGGALEFNQSLTRMTTLAGLTREQVDKLSPAIAAVAKETGKGRPELARALFFITSSGIAANKALGVLEQSAKASAIGMGASETVANAVTSAMNAYATSGLEASEATSILLKAVQEGKAEASELANAIGSVIPVAAEMGVTFNEVGATLATMTRLGTSADEAATQLGAVLSTLLAPAKETADELAKVGFSADGLRQSIKQRGLLATLEDLKRAFEGNEEGLARVFGNVRALRGVLGLLGENAEGTRQVFSNLAKTTGGEVNEAFNKWADTSEGKLARSLNRVKEAAITLGDTILPTLAEQAGHAVTTFNSLGEAAEKLFGIFEKLTTLGPPAAEALGVEALKVRLVSLGELLAQALQKGETAAAAAFRTAIADTERELAAALARMQQKVDANPIEIDVKAKLPTVTHGTDIGGASGLRTSAGPINVNATVTRPVPLQSKDVAAGVRDGNVDFRSSIDGVRDITRDVAGNTAATVDVLGDVQLSIENSSEQIRLALSSVASEVGAIISRNALTSAAGTRMSTGFTATNAGLADLALQGFQSGIAMRQDALSADADAIRAGLQYKQLTDVERRDAELALAAIEIEQAKLQERLADATLRLATGMEDMLEVINANMDSFQTAAAADAAIAAGLAAAAGGGGFDLHDISRNMFADGGVLRGPGGPRGDKIPIWGSDDEFMVNAPMSKKHRALLWAINEDKLPKFADGGLVSHLNTSAQRLASGGVVRSPSAAPSGGRGDVNIYMTVNATDAESFRRSERDLGRRAAAEFEYYRQGG